MGTFAIGALLNRGVQRLGRSEAFVNVGVWNGFSLLSAMEGNPYRLCIGIDDFSQFLGPQEAFMARFEKSKGPAHRFFDMDYEEYFAAHHQDPIGLYFYDGDHAYAHQLRGLEVAEPYFTEDCVVLVDDTNWEPPRRATLDFIAQSDREYELLLDVRTADAQHPSLWNGAIVFQATGRTGSRPGRETPADKPDRETATAQNPIDCDSRSTLVSLVVCNVEADGSALEATLEAALAQTWPNVEVLVVDALSSEPSRETLRRFEDRVVGVVPDAGQSPARAGLEASNGSFVALLDSRAHIDATAAEVGLSLPFLSRFLSRFDQGSIDERWQHHIRTALAARRDALTALPAEEEAFVFAGRRLTMPQAMGGRALPLFEGTGRMDSLDADGAIARLAELRGQGASFAMFTWETFPWLAGRPLLEQHLHETGRRVLDNDRVRVIEFERG